MSRVAIMCSGAQVDLESPHPSMIRAREIAHHLAMRVMYDGAPHAYYSVAQHCCAVAQDLARDEGPMAGLYALLHHAFEAFGPRGDLARANLDRVIHEAFDLDFPMPATVARALDQAHARVELWENLHLMIGREDRVRELVLQTPTPTRLPIRPVAWDKAFDRWLSELRIFATMAHIPLLPAYGDNR